MLSTPQKNRVQLIRETALKYNNFKDCDVIQDGINELAKAGENENMGEVEKAISYIITGIEFRGGVKTAETIEKLAKEILNYRSLLSAIQSGNKVAQEYFNKEAEAGEQICIIG